MKEKYLRAFLVALLVCGGIALEGSVREGVWSRGILAVCAPTFSNLRAPDRQTILPREGEKICYLTFDDGPSKYTESVLDILKEYDAKATFFVIGNNLGEGSEEILERIVEENHSIGLHANDHNYKRLYASTQSLLQDYETLYTRLKEGYGIETALYRLPGGSVMSYIRPHREASLRELRERGFVGFDWQISGEDAVGCPTVESIRHNVLEKALNYDTPIVLLHDGVGNSKTAEALPGIIEGLQKEGYRFASLETAPEYLYRAR